MHRIKTVQEKTRIKYFPNTLHIYYSHTGFGNKSATYVNIIYSHLSSVCHPSSMHMQDPKVCDCHKHLQNDKHEIVYYVCGS